MQLRKILTRSPLLAVPLFVVPAFCFATNRSAFLWSLIAIAFTGWRIKQAKSQPADSVSPAKGTLTSLALATLLLQVLAFAWIGAVWSLQGLAQVITQSPSLSRIVGWIQGQWFALMAAWAVLFTVVCGLFRLARPVLDWHRRAIQDAAALLDHPRVAIISSAPEEF